MVSNVGPDVEIGWVAATVIREQKLSDLPVALPSPGDGQIRLWMKHSHFNPRVLEVRLEERFTAVVEWPRDYVDVPEDDVLLAGARPEALDDRKSVLRLIVAHRLARRPRMVHRTWAVEHGLPGKPFEVYEEYDRSVQALERFRELALADHRYDSVDETRGSSDPLERAMLEANGLLGLTRTKQGRQVLRKIREAVERSLLTAPLKYQEYQKRVEDPLNEGEASVLVCLGVLCSRCLGMTWGETGYELMRGIRGV